LFSQLFEAEIILFWLSFKRRIGGSLSAKTETLMVSGEEMSCPVSAAGLRLSSVACSRLVPSGV